MEIDTVKEVAKYQAEVASYLQQLQQLDAQRAQFAQAIAERQGIIAFLTNLNHTEVKKDVDNKD